jgi:hypothetical protein
VFKETNVMSRRPKMRQLVNDDKLTRVEDERSLGSRKADVCHGRCPDAMVTTSMGKIPVNSMSKL